VFHCVGQLLLTFLLLEQPQFSDLKVAALPWALKYSTTDEVGQPQKVIRQLLLQLK
jgi:hypothetical protein